MAGFGIRVTIVEPGFFRTDFLDASSVRYGSLKIADYKQASAEMQSAFDARSHQQAGDPARLGQAMVRLANESRPPLRYVAGSDAASGILHSFQARRVELEEWHALSTSTDFVAQPVPAGE